MPRLFSRKPADDEERAVIHEMQQANMNVETMESTRVIDDFGQYRWFDLKMLLADMSPNELEQFIREVYQLRGNG